MKKISTLFTILSLLFIASNMFAKDIEQIYNGNRLVDSNNIIDEDQSLTDNVQYELAPIVVTPTDTIDSSTYQLNESPRNYLRDDYDRRQPEMEYHQDMHRTIEYRDRGVERGGRR